MRTNSERSSGSLAAAGSPADHSPATAARDTKMASLEAVLLIAREPLNSRRLAQLARLADGTEARTLIGRLNGCYDQDGTAFRVEEIAGGFQLLTRANYAAWLRRLHASPQETRLSSPALETLAVVAYRQPVLRAEIESIRGVQCGEMLRQLMDRELVRIVGRADELGRPFLYGTTKRFLQVFGLRHVDDLPRAEELRLRCSQNGAAAPSDETTSHDSREEPEVTVAPVTATDSPAAEAHREDEAQRPRNTVVASQEDVTSAVEDEDDYDEEFDEEDEWEDEEEEDDDLEEGEWEEVEDEEDDEEWDEEEDEEWDEEEEDEEDDDEEWEYEDDDEE